MGRNYFILSYQANIKILIVPTKNAILISVDRMITGNSGIVEGQGQDAINITGENPTLNSGAGYKRAICGCHFYIRDIERLRVRAKKKQAKCQSRKQFFHIHAGYFVNTICGFWGDDQSSVDNRFCSHIFANLQFYTQSTKITPILTFINKHNNQLRH